MATCNICGKTTDSPIDFPSGTKLCKLCARAHQLALPAAPSEEKIVLDPNKRIYALDRNLTYADMPNVPVDITAELDEMSRFYREVYGEKQNFANLYLPDDPGGYNRILPVVHGLTASHIWAEYRNSGLFLCHSYIGIGDDLDKAAFTNERTADKGSYIIRVRPCVEADEELRGLSADWIAKEGLATMTLPERLLLGRWYFWKTGEHLDKENSTLCSGSRDSGGFVPNVDWLGGGLYVRRRSLDYSSDDLRARSVIA